MILKTESILDIVNFRSSIFVFSSFVSLCSMNFKFYPPKNLPPEKLPTAPTTVNSLEFTLHLSFNDGLSLTCRENNVVHRYRVKALDDNN